MLQLEIVSQGSTAGELDEGNYIFAPVQFIKRSIIYLFYSQISSENNKSNVIAFKGYLIMHNQSIIEIFLCTAIFVFHRVDVGYPEYQLSIHVRPYVSHDVSALRRQSTISCKTAGSHEILI